MNTTAVLGAGLLLFLAGPTEARIIHFVGAFATGDRASGPSFQRMQARITGALQGLANEDLQRRGEFRYQQHSLDGDDFNRGNILGMIQSVPVGPDDTVIFYVTCHGYRLRSDRDSFGRLITDGMPGGTEGGLGVRQLHSALKERGARLTLTFVEACNEEMDVDVQEEGTGILSNETMIKAFLLRPRGDLLLAASGPGEYAFYRYESGGLFGDRLAALFEYVVQGKMSLYTVKPDHYPVDWKGAARVLAADTKHLSGVIYRRQQKTGELGQTPIFELNIVNN